jgi:hypothetical protein
MTDLRDVRGRLLRLVVSIPLGIVTSFFVAMSLPRRNHFAGWQCCMCGTGFIKEGDSFFIMLSGAVGAALAWYALLSWLARRPRRVRLPRATLLR